MKVVVCVKQVPDTKGGVKFKPDGTLDRGAMLAIMNPDDKAGLEAALKLKDQYGAEVTVVSAPDTKTGEVHLDEVIAPTSASEVKTAITGSVTMDTKV
jgi:electron transfer flavoprotein beta subunit